MDAVFGEYMRPRVWCSASRRTRFFRQDAPTAVNWRCYEVTHRATLRVMKESKVLRAIEPEASASSPPI